MAVAKRVSCGGRFLHHVMVRWIRKGGKGDEGAGGAMDDGATAREGGW